MCTYVHTSMHTNKKRRRTIKIVFCVRIQVRHFSY